MDWYSNIYNIWNVKQNAQLFGRIFCSLGLDMICINLMQMRKQKQIKNKYQKQHQTVVEIKTN